MTIHEYTARALADGMAMESEPEWLARHFAGLTGLGPTLEDADLPRVIADLGCSIKYRAKLGRSIAGQWNSVDGGSYRISIKRHKPCPRATFVLAHEVYEIIHDVARNLDPDRFPDVGRGREAEFRANRFAGELTVPFEDFWPRFCDSGLSVAAMGQHYRQSEHVIARQAKLTLAEICPMAIFVCPVVKPREDGILEYVAKGVSTQVVQVFDRQHSGTFRSIYTARGMHDLPARLDYREAAKDLMQTLVERRPMWIKRIRQRDLFQSYDLSAYIEVRTNSRKKLEELVMTVVRAEDGHYFHRRLGAERAIVVPEASSLFGRFRVSNRTYQRLADGMKRGELPDSRVVAVQADLPLADAADGRLKSPVHGGFGPLFQDRPEQPMEWRDSWA